MVAFPASLTRSALPASFYSDSVDSDVGRPYAQFPFFPLQVAETAFLKQLFLWCEANGKILNLNGPNTSLAVLHLCHSVTSDSSGPKGHWSLADRLVTMAAGPILRALTSGYSLIRGTTVGPFKARGCRVSGFL